MTAAPPLTDREQLLRAAAAAPKDDSPRLIFADWLEGDAPEFQRDPARAAFIRVQCEVARLEPDVIRLGTVMAAGGQTYRQDVPGRDIPLGIAAKAVPHPEYDALRRWEAEIGPKLRHRWAVDHAQHLLLPEHQPKPPYGYTVTGKAALSAWAHTLVEFRRGFPEVVQLNWNAWQDHHKRIREWVPVREVRLTDSPFLSNTEHLVGFGYRCHIQGRTVFADVPHVATYETVVPRLLETEWPGIAFKLPPRTLADMLELRNPPGGGGLPPEALEELRQEIIRRLGLPSRLIGDMPRPPELVYVGPAVARQIERLAADPAHPQHAQAVRALAAMRAGDVVESPYVPDDSALTLTPPG